jgi:hypothetical protein
MVNVKAKAKLGLAAMNKTNRKRRGYGVENIF